MVGEVGTSGLILFAVLLVLSAFFSGAEAALLSVQRVKIQHLVRMSSVGAARVARMIDRPDKLLPPILIGNNLVNTAAAALATAFALSVVDDRNRAILVATMCVAVILLVFGETIPKTIAARNAEKIAIIVSLPVQWISWILFPVSYFLGWASNYLARIFGGTVQGAAMITEDEIKAMISVGSETGAVEVGEAEMIRRVLEFGDRKVREVMTPRTEIIWIQNGINFKEFLRIYDSNYHTRFPVCDGDLDNVIGIVSLKDVIREISSGSDFDVPATNSLRAPYFVPETKGVQELFTEMRTTGYQLALIVDEFGGVAGLVTLRHLVEGIVGPVRDEDPSPVEEVITLGGDVFDLDASLSIVEANDRLGLDLPVGEYETIAGLILERLGKVPYPNEIVLVNQYRFTVVEMRGVRVVRVTMSRLPHSDQFT
jgi:putative hemolysin